MFSRLLLRMISGSRLGLPTRRKTSKTGKFKLQWFVHVFLSVVFRDPDGPKYRFNRFLFIATFFPFALVIFAAFLSYRRTTARLPDVLSNRATRAEHAGDYESEIDWRQRYLMVEPSDIDMQGRLAIAIDSMLKNQTTSAGDVNTFTAIRELETAENLSGQLSEPIRVSLQNRLSDRYEEASDLLVQVSSRHDDEAMQDSLTGESIGYLVKAIEELPNVDDDPAVDARIRKLIVKRSLVEQTINSPATFNMRSDITSDSRNERMASQSRSMIFRKKPSLWFDETLSKTIREDPVDPDFFNYLLVFRRNSVFPWREDNQDVWRSKVWEELPNMIEKRVDRLENAQSKLLSLRLASLSGDNDASEINRIWTSAADQICDEIESNSSDLETNKLDGQEKLAIISILMIAWDRLPNDQLEAHSRWWNQLQDLLQDDEEVRLASLYLRRGLRHLSEDEPELGKPFLTLCFALDTFVRLNAAELLLGIELAELELTVGKEDFESVNGNCRTALTNYQNAIRRETQRLQELDLPTTDRFRRLQTRLILGHRLNSEVFKIRQSWIGDKKIPSLDGLNELAKECARMDLAARFQLSRMDRVASILREAGERDRAATLYEDLLALYPKNTAIRNRCFDSWHQLGNHQRAQLFLSKMTTLTDVHGKTRILFSRLMDLLKDPENAEALGTLREHARILELSISETPTDQTDETSMEKTRLVLKFIQILLPPENTTLTDYINSNEMRDRLYALAAEGDSNPWLFGLAYGMRQFETQDRRNQWFDVLMNMGNLTDFQKITCASRADAALGNHWAAINRLFTVEGLTPKQIASARSYAADLAAIAAGYSAKREILLTIPEKERTVEHLYWICDADIELMAANRMMTDPSPESRIADEFREHLNKLTKLDSNNGRFQKLINNKAKYLLETMELRSDLERLESLEMISSELKELQTLHPWWTPLLTLRGLIAAELKEDEECSEILKLAVESGEKSVRASKALIAALDRQGKVQEAEQTRNALKQTRSEFSIVWTNYLKANPGLRSIPARLNYARNIALSFDVQEAWLLWASVLTDACSQRTSKKQFDSMLAQAYLCLDRAGEQSPVPGFRGAALRHRLALLGNNEREAINVEKTLQSAAADDQDAADTLVSCYLSRGKITEAVPFLQMNVQRDPTEERLVLLAKCLNGLGRSREVEATLKQTLDLYPQSTFARENFARWILKTETTDNARSKLKELLLDSDPDKQSTLDQFAYVRLINSADEKKFDDESIELLLSIASGESTLSESACRVGLRRSSNAIRSARANGEQAAMTLNQCMLKCYELLEQRGMLTTGDLNLYILGLFSIQPKVEQKLIDDLLERIQETGDSFLVLRYHLNHQRDEGSQHDLQQLIETWRDDALAEGKLPENQIDAQACIEFLEIENHQRAMEIFRIAYSKNPQLLSAYLDLLVKTGRDQYLIEFTRVALEMSSTKEQYELIARLGIRYLSNTGDPESQKFCRQLNDILPNNPTVLDFASQVSFVRGNYEQAATYLKALNRLQPENALVLNNLAMCLSELPDQLDESIQFAEEARDLAPHDPSVLHTLAVNYIRKQEFALAKKCLEHAIAIKKEPRYLFHLLIAYEKLGMPEKYSETFNLLRQIDIDVSRLSASDQKLYAEKFL